MKYAIISDVHGNLSAFKRAEQVLFVGHTHIPFIMKQPADKVRLPRSFDEDEAIRGMRGLVALKTLGCAVSPGARYIVNVGSVGIPRRGSPATYCVFDMTAQKIQLVHFT